MEGKDKEAPLFDLTKSVFNLCETDSRDDVETIKVEEVDGILTPMPMLSTVKMQTVASESNEVSSSLTSNVATGEAENIPTCSRRTPDSGSHPRDQDRIRKRSRSRSKSSRRSCSRSQTRSRSPSTVRSNSSASSTSRREGHSYSSSAHNALPETPPPPRFNGKWVRETNRTDTRKVSEPSTNYQRDERGGRPYNHRGKGTNNYQRGKTSDYRGTSHYRPGANHYQRESTHRYNHDETRSGSGTWNTSHTHSPWRNYHSNSRSDDDRAVERDTENMKQELSRIKSLNEHLENENSRQREEMISVLTRHENVQIELVETKLNKASLENEITKQKNSNKNLEDELLEAQIMLVEIQSKLDDVNQTMSDKEVELSVYTQENHELKLRISEGIINPTSSPHEAENETLRNENQELKTALQQLKHERDGFRMEICKLNVQLLRESQWKEQCLAEKRRVEEELMEKNEIVDKLNQEILCLRESTGPAATQDAPDSLRNMKFEVEEIQNGLEGCEAELVKLQEELTMSQATNKSLETALGNEKITSESLKKELEASKINNEKMKIEIDQLRGDTALERERLEKKIAEVKHQLTTKSDSIEKLMKEKLELEQEFQKVREGMETQLERTKTGLSQMQVLKNALEKDLEKYRRSAENLAKELKVAEVNNGMLSEELLIVKKKLALTTQAHQALQETLCSKENELLTQATEITELQTKIRNAEVNNIDTKKEVDAWVQACNNVQKNLTEVRAEKQDLKKQVKKLHAEKVKKSNERDDLIKELDDLKTEVEELKSQLTLKSNAEAKLLAEKQAIYEELTELKEIFESERSSAQVKEDQLLKESNLLKELTITLNQDLGCEISVLKEKGEQLQMQLDQTKAELKEVKASCDSLEKQLEEQKKTRESLAKELEDLQIDNAKKIEIINKASIILSGK